MGLTDLLRNKTIYDGKRLWEAYMGMGRASSHKRLREWAVSEGMVNRESGHVSQMGPYWAMWRYAINHPEEAFDAYKEHAEQYLPELMEKGITEITFPLFLSDLREKAKHTSVVSKKVYENFCEKYKKELGNGHSEQ